LVTSSIRRAGAILAGASLLLQLGCYTLTPTGGVIPPTGTRVAVSLNDAGRAVLGSLLGSEIDQVEGYLLQKDSTRLTLGVTATRSLRGGEQVWSGEKVEIKTTYITNTYERQFSKEKTLIASAIGVGALVFILTRALQGAATTPDTKVPGDTARTSRRLP